MSVWDVRCDVANFATMYLVNKFGQPLDFCPEWPDFEGQKIGKNCFQFKTKLKKNKPVANFTYLDCGVLVCDYFAITKIGDFISNEVELLPIDVDGLNCQLINILNVVDCLDEKKSEIKFFKNSKNVKDIKRYVFNEYMLRNINLFKIPQLKRTDIFATDTFRDKILESGLTGLDFRLVY
jgi:hypothetical protein